MDFEDSKFLMRACLLVRIEAASALLDRVNSGQPIDDLLGEWCKLSRGTNANGSMFAKIAAQYTIMAQNRAETIGEFTPNDEVIE